MRWFSTFVLSLALAGVALASGPDDQYLEIYNEVLQADSLQHDGQLRPAASRYAEAQARLKQFKAANPAWNPDVIAFRLQYLADKMQELGNLAPATNAPAATPTAPIVAPPGSVGPGLEQQVSALQEQMRALTSANAELQNKLKEALSIQPSAVSPVELSKREEEIVELKKERDLLTVSLEQAKAQGSAASTASNSKLTADLAAAQHEAAEANKKIEAEERESSALKAAAANQVPAADAARITEERDQLKAELAARSKELSESQARHDKEALAARDQLNEALAQRDDLQKKFDTSAGNAAEIERLRARVAVLEAPAVPLTQEELALLHQGTSVVVTPPVAAATGTHAAHTSAELPPGAGALMRDATRATMERDFPQAEQKYKDILRQDENNVYVLAYLADTQWAEGHLGDCEKTVERAISLDPNDPPSLFTLGILRYRQERLDEALDALSRSAKLNPTNAATQNYLGCVLADKGLRPSAETAFRTALQLEPEYRDAHFNLAMIYATEKPTSPELARWHYKRAVDLGHPKSPSLEATLASLK